MLMKKPLKFRKSSFIFLETIFAVVILSFVIGGFLKLTYDKESVQYSLQQIYNAFLQHTHTQHTSVSAVSLPLTKDDGTIYVLPAQRITYEDKHIKLIHHEL